MASIAESYHYEISTALPFAFLLLLLALMVAATLFLRRRHLAGVLEFSLGVGLIEGWSIYDFVHAIRFEPTGPGQLELMLLVLTIGALLIVLGIVRLLRSLARKTPLEAE